VHSKTSKNNFYFFSLFYAFSDSSELSSSPSFEHSKTSKNIFFFTVKLALSSSKLKERKEFFKLSQACHLSSTAQRQKIIFFTVKLALSSEKYEEQKIK
jgi:hypothetical protein